MHVAVVHNTVSTEPHASTWDVSHGAVLGQVNLVRRSLEQAGHDCWVCAADDAKGLIDALVERRPDVVFNCCESFRGRAALEMNVAALFELLELPFTGSAALTLGASLDKSVAKALLVAHGVMTPPSAAVRDLSDLPRAAALPFPLIVKPLWEDASIGIDRDAVVESPAALERRVRLVWRDLRQPALVESFIDGPEFQASLLAMSPCQFRVLPVSEIDFDPSSGSTTRILTYAAKWDEASREYRGTPSRCPAQIDEGLAERIRATALAAASALDVRDYGRVDLRLRASDGAVFVLEVNPNPDLNADAGFMGAARADGRTDEDVIREILARCVERTRSGAP